MTTFFNILLVRVSIILILNILWSNVDIAANSEDRTFLRSIQSQIESGNLSEATRLLEKIDDSAYKRALQANIAARVGDYDAAITLYDSLLDYFQGKNQYRIVWNYIQVLKERMEYYDWQLSQEYDPLSRQSLQESIKADRNLALSLARSYREDLEIAILLWQLSPAEVSLGELREQVLALKDSQLKVESLLAIKAVDKAVEVAQRMNEPRFLSWAYGERGKKQLKRRKVADAIASFDVARIAANQVQDYLALARWQGYLGKAHAAQGEIEKAKLNYEVAVNAIEQIRKDLAGYRVDPLLIKEIQPILRDYLALLLNSSDRESLIKAIAIQKLSTLSELDAYFKNLCNVDEEKISQVKTDTVYIHSIILEERLHIIVQSKEGYFSTSIAIAKPELEQQLYRWRLALADPSADRYIEDGRKLYDLLISPIEPQIQGKKRLIFVQDGLLRTVPMAALIDGEEFLIERYVIAYSLGFKLQSPDQRLKTALVAGSSVTSTEVLPSVNREVISVGQLLSADILSGNELSERSFTEKLQSRSYDIVHVATRNSIVPNIEQSRFSLGKQEISLLEFEQILRNRKGEITFLNLAGCDTASGNSIAILGLTGIGIRSGIVHTVGSLWGIPDETTANFMIQFYKNLQTTENYDDSLRQAQLNMIENPLLRPYTWAGFIVLTNE